MEVAILSVLAIVYCLVWWHLYGRCRAAFPRILIKGCSVGLLFAALAGGAAAYIDPPDAFPIDVTGYYVVVIGVVFLLVSLLIGLVEASRVLRGGGENGERKKGTV
jgi:hypothetical protein